MTLEGNWESLPEKGDPDKMHLNNTSTWDGDITPPLNRLSFRREASSVICQARSRSGWGSGWGTGGKVCIISVLGSRILTGWGDRHSTATNPVRSTRQQHLQPIKSIMRSEVHKLQYTTTIAWYLHSPDTGHRSWHSQPALRCGSYRGPSSLDTQRYCPDTLNTLE